MSERQKRNAKLRLLLSTGLGLMAVALSGVAPAQAPDDEGGEEVVVTATRRAVQVRDVPASVSAYSGQALEKQNITTFQDLVKIDPTFAATNYGAAFNTFIIRGVASQTGSTVGVYLDEAPIIGGTLTEDGGDGKPGLRLHDVQRVEILRGPQGTLFGSSSMSGTLRVITNRPDYEAVKGSWAAQAQTVDDGNPLYMGDMTLNVPVVKGKAAIRASVWGESGGGYIDQITDNFTYTDANDVSTLGGRVSFGADLTPDFNILAMYVHQEIKVDGTQAGILGLPDYVSSSPSVEPYSDDYDLGYIEASYDIGFGSLLAAYSHTDQWVSRTADTSRTCNNFGVPGACSISQTQEFEADTYELRFTSDFEGPFQLVLGGFYQDSTVSNDTSVKLANAINGKPPCVTYLECIESGDAANIVFSTLDNIDVAQYAIYAQGDYKLTDKLTATVGVRYYSADITDYGLVQQDVFASGSICFEHYGVPRPVCGFALGDITVPYAREGGSSTETKTTYNFSLLYELDDALSFYARAASGFRIGGVNNISLLAGSGGVDVPSSYAPDSLWSYELGVKGSFWDRMLTLDLAIYRINWSDQHIGATDPSGAFDFTLNAGETEINGVELQGQFRPVAGLTFSGGITYTDATLAEDLPSGSTAIGFKGDFIPSVAKWRGSIMGEYEWDMNEETEGYVQLSANFRSETASAFNSTDPNYVVADSYWLVDAAVGVRYADWDARLFVQNVANEAAQLAVNPGTDGTKIFTSRPRSFGIRLSSSF